MIKSVVNTISSEIQTKEDVKMVLKAIILGQYASPLVVGVLNKEFTASQAIEMGINQGLPAVKQRFMLIDQIIDN